MQQAGRVRVFGGLLTLFGLFAVYSTSIRKSFDQGATLTIIQNIETVKAFNTFLDETLIKPTANILAQSAATEPEQMIEVPLTSAEDGGGEATLDLAQAEPQVLLPSLETLEDADAAKNLVSVQKKTIKNRDNYKYFSNQIRSLIVSLIGILILYFLPIGWFQNKKMILALLIAVTAFQLLVFVPGLEARYGTARGWVDIPGLPNMQPSEFFKI